jgi:hypothetical protein
VKGGADMEKLSAWLFLLVAVAWLLPLIGVVIGSMDVHSWIAALALGIAAITEIVKGK